MKRLALWSFCLVGCTVLGDRLDGIADGNHCTSGVQDADETDEDCGGADCEPCLYESTCRSNADCTTGYCAEDDSFHYCACPPEMVPNVRPEDGVTFCIDKLEVSMGNYQAFLSYCDGKGGCVSECDGPWTIDTPVSDDPAAGCTSEKFDPINTPDRPVVCVHLCDAFAYCKALGKRVCGNYVEDTYPATLANDPNVSEWFNACSQSGDFDFPYGTGFVAASCNGASTSSANVGTFPNCGSGAGPLDMSGNVREWEAVYDETTDSCHARGGSFQSNDDPQQLGCKSKPFPLDCGDVKDDIGFRCCSG